MSASARPKSPERKTTMTFSAISVLSAAVLLPLVAVSAASQDEPLYQLTSKFFPRHHSFIPNLLMQPRKLVKKAKAMKKQQQKRDISPVGLGLETRQIFGCPRGTNECELFPGFCCNTGTTCFPINDFFEEIICCPNDMDCTDLFEEIPEDLGECSPNEIACPSGDTCCPRGESCVESASGTLCNIGGGGTPDEDEDIGGDMCGPGFDPCTNIPLGCCPTGVDCIPPNMCAIRCKPDDPPCGSGCCKSPLVCSSDGGTCVPEGGSDIDDPDSFTSIDPETLSLPTRLRSSTTTNDDDDGINTDTSSTRFIVLKPTRAGDETATITDGSGESTPTGGEEEVVVTVTAAPGAAERSFGGVRWVYVALGMAVGMI